MNFSRWHSVTEFLNSTAFRKEISYRIILSPTCSLVARTSDGVVRQILSLRDKFGRTPECDVRLCFNGLPVRGRIVHFVYGDKRFKV